MKHPITTLLAGLALALGTATAHAADNHGDHKPLHGGFVSEAAHLDFELVAAPGQISLYVRDHAKPVAIDGASAKLTLLNGKDKTEAQLQPAGDHLRAHGEFKVAPGTKAVAAVTLPGKKPINVRFALK